MRPKSYFLYFVYAIQLILVTSCIKETLQYHEIIHQPDKKNTISLTTEYSEEEAYAEICTQINELQESGWENSINTTATYSIEYVPGEYLIPYLSDLHDLDINLQTSGEEFPEISLYLFNFSNGCAVVAADIRFNMTIIALIEGATLYPENFLYERTFSPDSITIDYATEHPTLPLTNIMYYAAASFKNNPEEIVPFEDWYDSISVILPTPIPYFHQRDPFNYQCPVTIYGNKAPAGCGAIAMLAVIVYTNSSVAPINCSYDRDYWMRYGYNDSYEETLLHREEISSLVRTLGNLANSHYSTQRTSTQRDSIVYVMNQLGFDMSVQNFDVQTTFQMFSNNKPLIISAKSDSVRHAFVVSGLLVKARHLINMSNGNIIYENKVLMYCNWLLNESEAVNNSQGMPEKNRNGWFLFPELSFMSFSSEDIIAKYFHDVKMLKY